ncbi:exopolysaccharide biosynthesis polyprenyl glycosylphosphotransferase [Bifidobacterium aquikefiri]|uniref:Exopolysaccharide biosynthesis polyprenyl glycosylphosphotransferase n=2 Tax=Bifidobacterium aquikefiri TaxID=1653207 RepID=A0A261G3K5_9BIFI|nr:sugar transferase [Bifidobacterium aquikefiri]OZG65596.1 exopolysaccharide biosynthesis polyprenyl glycosylphosphotransferase [Bifidobacterium aquikefiri]
MEESSLLGNADGDTTYASQPCDNPTMPPSFAAQRHAKPFNLNVSFADIRHGAHKAQIPRWRYLFMFALILEDLAVFLFSLVICFVLKPESYITLSATMPTWLFMILQCGIWLAALGGCGAYQRHIMTDGYRIYTMILNSAFITIVGSGYLVYMFELSLPRTAVIEAPALAACLEILMRWGFKQYILRIRNKGQCLYNTVIIGSPQGIIDNLRMLKSSSVLGYRPIAVCPVVNEGNGSHNFTAAVEGPVYFSEFPVRFIPFSSDIANDLHAVNTQILLVTDTVARDSEQMRALSLLMESRGIELAFTVSVADVGGHRLHLRDSSQLQVLSASLPQYSYPAAILKRLYDIVVSAAALIVIGPLLIFPAALAIKNEDNGPVFYSQERIGKDGKPFKIFKLRSMHVNADKMAQELAEQTGKNHEFIFKLKDDPRITQVGKTIRKYSIDELPQFFNVLKGDMSIVGPGPHLQKEVQKFNTLYSTRLLVKPGITGPWQISGRSNLTQELSEQLDVSYIENWSITGDIVITLKTAVAIFKAVGAY